MTKSQRQPYGLGSFVKKFTKPIKKVLKSPIGKAALLGGLGWAANAGKLGGLGSGWLSKIAPAAGNLWSKYRNLKGGQQALLGLGALAVGTPLWQKMMKTGPYEEIEEEVDEWDIQPSSIANIMGEAKDYYRNYDPYLSSLNYMPPKWAVDPSFYTPAKEGGLAKLANGGGVAEAQAEQMLKMEYQKYRNQGGTMSYQQFKMAVLQQAQGQGPMAQGPTDRPMFQGGELVTDESMVEATPAGLMEENIEEVQGEPTREQLEALAMEIFQLRLEELDEEQLMVVYQAAMEQQPQEEMMQEEAVQFAANGGIIGSHVPGYTTPAGYNQLDYPSGGVRVRRAEGGLMSLGGMEKDYRQEGGFVPLGKEERADDVPARLSKNEFVFTADAVRNAGGGDIDAGAEVMENVMNHLESGGQISEESQGAQGMYDNMRQLETRVA